MKECLALQLNAEIYSPERGVDEDYLQSCCNEVKKKYASAWKETKNLITTSRFIYSVSLNHTCKCI